MTESRHISERGLKRASPLAKWTLWSIAILVTLSALGVVTVAYVILRVDRTPRELAPYLVRRAEGHRPLAVEMAAFIAKLLNGLDRSSRSGPPIPLTWVGAFNSPTTQGEAGDAPNIHRHLVGSTQSLSDAVAAATPGDIIELEPGRYRIDGSGIRVTRPGEAGDPITLRAAHLGDVVLESAAVEAFKINVQDWRFENLIMRGICRPLDDSNCEHAFHIVGNAKRVVIRNSVIEDFNAQIKINGEDGAFPDDGVIEHDTLTDTRPRATSNPVTPIDLDGASGWLITGNLITDFVKAGGNGVSYGAFAKAAGQANVFERNVILCEDKLQHQEGERIGLSLGGGGSGPGIRRDYGRSGLEQDRGRIADNLIAFCSDAGIYVNRSKNSQIDHNTLLDTAGIVVRFPESTAEIDENIIDGIITARDGASMSTQSNEQASLLGLFVGWHPQRQLFVDSSSLRLEWTGLPPRGPMYDSRPDLCGAPRALHTVLGAFEKFSACLGIGKKPN